jgi:chromosome segregation ATPase
MDERVVLQSRLRNCLQTILEFESDLEFLREGETLQQDFSHLRGLLERLDDELAPTENEVRRVEKATAALLRELEQPLSMLRKRLAQGKSVQ